MNDRNLFPTLLSRRSTQNLFNSLNNEMARVFSEFDAASYPKLNVSDGDTPFLPTKLDYSETDNNVEVTVEVPGFKEEDIDVELTGRVLAISGKRETRTEEEKKDYRIAERESGSFLRKINLDFDADSKMIVANVEAGVLTVTIQKPEDNKTKKQKIAIQAMK